MSIKKINVTDTDMTWNRSGLGFNNYNFIRNVAPRISRWSIEVFQSAGEDTDANAKKLRCIANIIDNDTPTAVRGLRRAANVLEDSAFIDNGVSKIFEKVEKNE